MINLILFISCIVFLGSLTVLKSTNSAPTLFHTLQTIPQYDKILHYILIGILTYLSSAVFSPLLQKRGVEYPQLILGLIIAAMISLEEISQAYFPSRSCSWLDAASGILGIITALTIYKIITKKPLALKS